MAKKNFGKLNFDLGGLRDVLTDTISTVADKVLDLADAAADTAKSGQQLAKLYVEKKKEESALEDAYKELGKLYYEEKGMAPEGAYVAACERSTAARAAIETNNARIDELKDKDDEEDVVEEAAVVEEVAAEPVAEEEKPAEEQ